MELLLLIVVPVVVLSALDVLALTFGVDSRDTIGDDHALPIRG
jgi:hypothetical protein